MEQIHITLPDGSVKDVPKGTTAADVARSISPRLADAALVARVAAPNDGEGELVDLRRPLDHDVKLQILTEKDPDALFVFRHSAAHLLAAAVMDLTDQAGVDAVIEMDLAANAGLYPGILHARSQVVVYGTGKAESQIPSQFLLVNAVTLRWIFVYELTKEERAAVIATITGMIEERRLIHNVALTLPLDRVVQAHETVEQGKAAGNVVLTIP